MKLQPGVYGHASCSLHDAVLGYARSPSQGQNGSRLALTVILFCKSGNYNKQLERLSGFLFVQVDTRRVGRFGSLAANCGQPLVGETSSQSLDL